MSRIEIPSENKLGACPAVVHGDVSQAVAAIIVMQVNDLQTLDIEQYNIQYATVSPSPMPV